MKFAIIENGLVANIALAEKPIEGNWIKATNDARIGGTWDGKNFGPPPQPDPTEARNITSTAIMDERNRRMRASLAFGGHVFDIDQGSLQRITGAATLAGFALGQGAQAGDLLWHGGDDPFSWITADNQIVTMDAPTVFAFGQAAANHESQHIFAARALKDMDPIPDDWADDKWWP